MANKQLILQVPLATAADVGMKYFFFYYVLEKKIHRKCYEGKSISN